MAQPQRNTDRLKNWIAAYENSGIPIEYRNATYKAMLDQPPFVFGAEHIRELARIEGETSNAMKTAKTR